MANKHVDLIKAAPLFERFGKLGNSADIDQLKGMVLTVAEAVGPLHDRIPDTFPLYTAHDFGLSLIHI